MSITSIIEGLSVLEKISSDLLIVELSGNVSDNTIDIRKIKNGIRKALTSVAFDIRNRVKDPINHKRFYSLDESKFIDDILLPVKNLINSEDCEIAQSFLENYVSLILHTNFAEKNKDMDELNGLVFSIISERFS